MSRNKRKTLLELSLTDNEYQAVAEIKSSVANEFDVERIVLFGSVARGEADEESDLDLLILTKKQLNRWERHKITDMVCEINLKYDTNFSTLVVDNRTWNQGPVSLLNIHAEVQRDGIPV